MAPGTNWRLGESGMRERGTVVRGKCHLRTSGHQSAPSPCSQHVGKGVQNWTHGGWWNAHLASCAPMLRASFACAFVRFRRRESVRPQMGSSEIVAKICSSAQGFEGTMRMTCYTSINWKTPLVGRSVVKSWGTKPDGAGVPAMTGVKGKARQGSNEKPLGLSWPRPGFWDPTAGLPNDKEFGGGRRQDSRARVKPSSG